MKCPRCRTTDGLVRKEGKQDNRVLWTIYYCEACHFTWRDTEPEETIDSGQRPAVFQIAPDQAENYPLSCPRPK